MVSNPRVGQLVRIAYAARRRKVPGFGPVGIQASWAPFQGKTGPVAIASRGRNHGVEIDGSIVVVPSGHLMMA
jgi:hypothetical protein